MGTKSIFFASQIKLLKLLHQKDKFLVDETLVMRGASCHLHTKYGKKILPELGDPEERGPSSISEAVGDRNKRIINALITSDTQRVKIQNAVVSHNT